MKKSRGETHNPILEAQNLFGGVGLKLPYIYPLLFFSWSKIEIGNKGVASWIHVSIFYHWFGFCSIFLFGKKTIYKGR